MVSSTFGEGSLWVVYKLITVWYKEKNLSVPLLKSLYGIPYEHLGGENIDRDKGESPILNALSISHNHWREGRIGGWGWWQCWSGCVETQLRLILFEGRCRRWPWPWWGPRCGFCQLRPESPRKPVSSEPCRYPAPSFLLRIDWWRTGRSRVSGDPFFGWVV